MNYPPYPKGEVVIFLSKSFCRDDRRDATTAGRERGFYFILFFIPTEVKVSRKNKVRDGFKSDCLKGGNPFCRSLLRGRSQYSIVTFCGAKSALCAMGIYIDATLKKIIYIYKKMGGGRGGGIRLIDSRIASNMNVAGDRTVVIYLSAPPPVVRYRCRLRGMHSVLPTACLILPAVWPSSTPQ